MALNTGGLLAFEMFFLHLSIRPCKSLRMECFVLMGNLHNEKGVICCRSRRSISRAFFDEWLFARRYIWRCRSTSASSWFFSTFSLRSFPSFLPVFWRSSFAYVFLQTFSLNLFLLPASLSFWIFHRYLVSLIYFLMGSISHLVQPKVVFWQHSNISYKRIRCHLIHLL